MKNRFKFAIFGLTLGAFTPFVAKSANEPIYVYEGMTVQDMAELMQKEMMRDKGGINKVGEFLYSFKESFVSTIENMPTDIAYLLVAWAKAFDIKNEKSAQLLSALDEVRHAQRFEKMLADNRLGVEPMAVSNRIAESIGLPTGMSLGTSALRKAGLIIAPDALGFLHKKG